MDAMMILRRCRNAEEDLRRIRQRIRQRREAMTGISGPSADPSGGSRGSEPDKLGRMVADLDALERKLAAREQARAVETAAACVLLDGLPDLENRVLYRYYVRVESVPAVAKAMKYSEGYVRRIKARGERMMREVPAEAVAAALPAWYPAPESAGK